MYFNPYEAQMMMEERVKDVLREAEQERLGRVYERVGFVGYATMLAHLDSLSA